jgi:hypothetical protein
MAGAGGEREDLPGLHQARHGVSGKGRTQVCEGADTGEESEEEEREEDEEDELEECTDNEGGHKQEDTRCSEDSM